jgi:2-methylcitrate dehydratase
MVAVPLIFGRLTANDYHDNIASDPRIDDLREKMMCVEDKTYSIEYHDPEKRSIGNAILITLKDGTELPEVEVEYPVGHKFRREEGIPLLEEKFKRHLNGRLGEKKTSEIYAVSENLDSLQKLDVDDYVNLYVTE